MRMVSGLSAEDRRVTLTTDHRGPGMSSEVETRPSREAAYSPRQRATRNRSTRTPQLCVLLGKASTSVDQCRICPSPPISKASTRLGGAQENEITQLARKEMTVL